MEEEKRYHLAQIGSHFANPVMKGVHSLKQMNEAPQRMVIIDSDYGRGFLAINIKLRKMDGEPC